MLQLTVKMSPEGWDESKQEFVDAETKDIRLEHSLISISKWESKWKKPFLQSDKTNDEIYDYIRCMILDKNVSKELVDCLCSSTENVTEIKNYIEDTMTATTFNNETKSTSREIVTSELIYYWMVALNIPFECEKWPLNRLLTLIRICNIKSQPPKKYKATELMNRNAALNAARKKQLNTRG